MVFHHQIQFNLAIETDFYLAGAISLHRVAPWYLKLITFSDIWPFKLTSALKKENAFVELADGMMDVFIITLFFL